MDEAAVRHASALLVSAREELVRADGKAALLLASAGVAVGAVLAAMLAGSWRPSDLPNHIEWLWWLGAVGVALGIAALGFAVYPRIRVRGPRSATIAYFGDVLAADRKDLVDRLHDAASSESALVDQLWAVSSIVRRKYVAIQWSLWALAVGTLACLLAVGLAGVLGPG